jgi:chromosomal replication initiation ATPase DnaA
MKVRIIIKDDQDFLEKIETTLLKQTGLKIKTIRAKTRTREVVRIRCIVAYLIKENTTMTLSSIGNYLNGKDHSSVIHMLNTIEDWKSQPKAWVKELHLLNNLDIALKGYSKNDLIDWVNISNEIPETIKSTIINKIHTFIS